MQVIEEIITRMKSGRDFTGLVRSTVESGSTLRWPLWPENATRKASSFVAWMRSISDGSGFDCGFLCWFCYFYYWNVHIRGLSQVLSAKWGKDRAFVFLRLPSTERVIGNVIKSVFV